MWVGSMGTPTYTPHGTQAQQVLAEATAAGRALRAQVPGGAQLQPALHMAVSGIASMQLPVSPVLPALVEPLHSHRREGSSMCWSQVPSLPSLP